MAGSDAEEEELVDEEELEDDEEELEDCDEELATPAAKPAA